MGALTSIITPWHTVSLTRPGKPSWNTSARQMRGPESGLRSDLLRTPAGEGGSSHPGLCGLRLMLSHLYYQVSLTWAGQWGKAPAGLHGLGPQPALASRHMSFQPDLVGWISISPRPFLLSFLPDTQPDQGLDS